MNGLRKNLIHVLRLFNKSLESTFVSNYQNVRTLCDYVPRISTEKSVNQVTLLGRVGVNPQLRGTESRPVVVFTLATNVNYKYESGEVHQKTDWHRISVFKPYLREIVLEYLKKGSRVYVEGRIVYGEFSDTKGEVHNTTSIVANEVIFVGSAQRKDDEEDVEVDSV